MNYRRQHVEPNLKVSAASIRTTWPKIENMRPWIKFSSSLESGTGKWKHRKPGWMRTCSCPHVLWFTADTADLHFSACNIWTNQNGFLTLPPTRSFLWLTLTKNTLLYFFFHFKPKELIANYERKSSQTYQEGNNCVVSSIRCEQG